MNRLLAVILSALLAFVGVGVARGQEQIKIEIPLFEGGAGESVLSRMRAGL